MSSENPLNLIDKLLQQQTYPLSPEKLAEAIIAVHMGPLANCENAQAIIAGLLHQIPYATAIKATGNSSSGNYED